MKSLSNDMRPPLTPIVERQAEDADRMARPANRGRPPASERKPEEEAEVDYATTEIVPPMRCPLCGRYQQPRLVKGQANKDGGRTVSCRFCAKRYVYRPATVRPL